MKIANTDLRSSPCSSRQPIESVETERSNNILLAGPRRGSGGGFDAILSAVLSMGPA